MTRLSKSLLSFSILCTIGFPSITLAAYGLPEPVAKHWYFAAFAGVAFPSDTTLNGVTTKYKTGYDGGAALGYRMDSIRFEGEYLYQRAGIDTQLGQAIPDSGSFRVVAGMFNVLYDFGDMYSTYVPYIGGGLGYAHVRQTQRQDDDELGYQAMIGIGFNIERDFTFSLGYRYFATTKASRAMGKRFQNHLLNVKFMYYFL